MIGFSKNNSALFVLSVIGLLLLGHAASAEETFRTVTVTGSLAAYADKNGFRDWMVFVTTPMQPPDLQNKAQLKQLFEDQGKAVDTAEKFPVSPDGQFKAVIHNARKGDGYYLHFGEKDPRACGAMRFSVTADHVELQGFEPQD